MSHEMMTELISRLNKLGIKCEHAPSTDRIDAPIAAVVCFPMHMVAGTSVLIDSTDQDQMSFKKLFQITAVREAFVIGEQENSLPVSDADVKVLDEMLAFHRSADIIIYEYALDTLSLYFTMANADVVDLLKTVIARSVVAVSKAAGEGWFGSGGLQVTTSELALTPSACVSSSVNQKPPASCWTKSTGRPLPE